MLALQRLKLRFGPYNTPQFQYGAKVTDAIRGEVVIVGLHDGKIFWPIGKVGRSRAIILYGDLAKAVRNEAAVAIQHWFGVGPATVQKWRRELGVEHENSGTTELRREHFDQPWGQQARLLAHARARDPVRRAKIAASRRGKSRPPHVIEAMRKASTGKRLSAETRRKMSEAHKTRGTRPPNAGRPWTPEEDKLCRLLRPNEVVQRTGRSLSVVNWRRRILGLPDGGRQESTA